MNGEETMDDVEDGKEKVKWIEFHEFIFLTIPFVTCCHIPQVNNLK